MFDSDENEEMGQVSLLGCPVGLALVLVGVLLVLVVGGSIMAFAFPSATPVPDAEAPLSATLPATENESSVITEEADALIVTEALDVTEENITEEAEVTADSTAEATTES